jgi:hypothetical protein
VHFKLLNDSEVVPKSNFLAFVVSVTGNGWIDMHKIFVDLIHGVVINGFEKFL